MKKFKDEHDKLEEMEREKANLLLVLKTKEENCSQLEKRIKELQGSLDSNKNQSESDRAKAEKEKEELHAKLILETQRVEDTEGRLAKLLEEEKASHRQDVEDAKRKQKDLEKKLHDELSFHAKAEKELSAKDQALTSTEKHRDKLLQDLEDEKRRRQELQASLLMAKESSQLEVSEVARKMAKEKEEALQAQMDQLTKERSDLNDKLKREILAVESEKKSANERLALIQQKQADAMRKFKEEHDKVAKVEAERAELLIRIEHDETACKDLKQQIQELKKVLDNTKEHQEMDLSKIKKEKKELENQLNSVSATLGETQKSLKRLLDEEKMAHKETLKWQENESKT